METENQNINQSKDSNPKSDRSSNNKTQKIYAKTQNPNTRYETQGNSNTSQTKFAQTQKNPRHKKLPPINLNQSQDFRNSYMLYSTQTFSNSLPENPNQPIKSEPKLSEDDLKEELTLLKLELNKKTQELYELKIQFSKQLDENKNNKKLIEEILNIDPNKPITKAEAKDKIEYAKPNKKQIKKLEEAYEAIELKAEIQKCKKEYTESFAELDRINKNAKTSTITKINNEINLKDENSRKVNRTIKRMEKQIEENSEYIELYKSQCEELKNFADEAQKNEKESKEKSDELENNRREKMKKISELEEKLRKKKEDKKK